MSFLAQLASDNYGSLEKYELGAPSSPATLKNFYTRSELLIATCASDLIFLALLTSDREFYHRFLHIYSTFLQSYHVSKSNLVAVATSLDPSMIARLPDSALMILIVIGCWTPVSGRTLVIISQWYYKTPSSGANQQRSVVSVAGQSRSASVTTVSTASTTYTSTSAAPAATTATQPLSTTQPSSVSSVPSMPLSSTSSVVPPAAIIDENMELS